MAEEPTTAPVAEEPTHGSRADEPLTPQLAGGTTTVEYFRPFEYRADSTIALETIDTRKNGRGALIAFTVGADVPYPMADDGTIKADAKGVTVSSAKGG